jgi:hypothetical protein
VAKKARTYQLDADTIELIDFIAGRLEVHQSRVVGMLLDRALREVEAGRWELDRRPKLYEPVWVGWAAGDDAD